MKILLAEDELALGEWLSKALEQSGFRVDWQNDGRLIENSLDNFEYDALILDLGLPGRSGNEILKKLRSQDKRLPVLILTARNSLSIKISSLYEGADDFLAKPFELAELEARLTALIRRSRGIEHPRMSFGPLFYDAMAKQFKLNEDILQLSPREYSLLKIFISKTGEPLSRKSIMERVFGDEEDVQISAVEVLIHRVRKRLENSGVHIHTYRGIGYALEMDAAIKS